MKNKIILIVGILLIVNTSFFAQDIQYAFVHGNTTNSGEYAYVSNVIKFGNACRQTDFSSKVNEDNRGKSIYDAAERIKKFDSYSEASAARKSYISRVKVVRDIYLDDCTETRKKNSATNSSSNNSQSVETNYNSQNSTYNSNNSYKNTSNNSVETYKPSTNYSEDFGNWADEHMENTQNGNQAIDPLINASNAYFDARIAEENRKSEQYEYEEKVSCKKYAVKCEQKGDVNFKDGDYEYAVGEYSTAIVYYKKSGFQFNESRLNSKISNAKKEQRNANIFYNNEAKNALDKGDYKTAIIKYRKAKKYGNINKYNYCKALEIVSDKFCKQKKFIAAYISYLEILEYKIKEQSISKKIKNISKQTASEYATLAKNSSDFKKKNQYFLKSLELDSDNPNVKSELSKSSEQLGDEALRKSYHAKAVNHYTTALKYANKKKEKAIFEKLGDAKLLLIDERDGKVYGTVVINGQRWMTNDLEYEPEIGSKLIETEDITFSNDRSGSSWRKEVRIYNFKIRNEVCPVGWHPIKKEEMEVIKDNLISNLPKEKRDSFLYYYHPTIHKSLRIGGNTGLNLAPNLKHSQNLKKKVWPEAYCTERGWIGLVIDKNGREFASFQYNAVLFVKKHSFAMRCVEDVNGKIKYKSSLVKWFEIGMQLFEEKKYKYAAKCFEYSILFEKDTKTYKYALANAGLCYRLLGNYDKALEYLNKRLDFDKNDAWTLNQINLVNEKK